MDSRFRGNDELLGLVGGAGAVGVGVFGPRIGMRGMFGLLSLFALELAALAAVEGRVLGARCWVLGWFTLPPALSHDGGGGRPGGV